MKKALKILLVFTTVLIIAAFPLFNCFAYDYTTEYIYSDELSFNTNYHIETYNKSGSKVYDYNGPINAHVPTFYYSDGTTSLSNGVLHTDLFMYLDQNEFDTFQYGYIPNEPQSMYRGLIGHGFRFTNVIPRFEQYYDPNFELVSVTFSFQAVFYVESVGLTSSPDFSFRFYSNNALGVKLTPTYTRPFNNSYSGTGFLASFDVNFLVSDFETFINDFIGISFAWDHLVGSDSSYGNNQVFVYAFNVMNVTIESGDLKLSNVNQSIINGNHIQQGISNKLDGVQSSIAGLDESLNQDVIFNGNFGSVDYTDPDQLDAIFNDSYSSFSSDFSSFWYENFVGDSNLFYALTLYGQMMNVGYTKLTFINPILSVLLLFLSINVILGIVGVARGIQRNNESDLRSRENSEYRSEMRRYHSDQRERWSRK